MFSLSYPAILKPDPKGQGYTVNFPGLPEALTDGKNLAEALKEAADCLGVALASRMVLKEAIPAPCLPRRGQPLVSVPLYLAPKVALYIAMREQGISNSELARRLRCTETVVRRMLDPKHNSKPEGLQAALEAVGKRLLVAVDDAA
jgi:antitoxin HicB